MVMFLAFLSEYKKMNEDKDFIIKQKDSEMEDYKLTVL